MRICGGFHRLRALFVRHVLCQGLEFERPEMEAQFQADRARYVATFTRFWILVQVAMNCVALVLRCEKYGWFTKPDSVFYVQLLPFAFFCLLFLAMHVGFLRQHTYQLLCITNLGMVAWIAWDTHLMARLEDQQIEASTLAEVFAALQPNPRATETLLNFVVREEARKYLWYTIVLDFFLLDLLQFLGLRWESVLVLSSVPLSVFILSQVSPYMTKDILEVFMTCVVVTVYTSVMSYFISRTRRQQFVLNHRLQSTLEKEAAALREAAEREAALKEASQEADTILNHLLKNVMADAAGCIHLYLQGLPTAADAEQALPADLLLATQCLERGVAWCRKRQALLRMACGKYTPQVCEVDLLSFGRSLVQGRSIDAEFPDVVVTVDPLLCEIVLENALGNAVRHGHPTHPGLRFAAALTLVEDADRMQSDRRCLTFVVQNRAHPSRPPLDPEFAVRLLRGQELPLDPAAPRLSEHLGMQHLCQAARVHGMALRLTQAGDVVRFEAALEVAVQPGSAPRCDWATAQPPAIPPGLRVFCIDDSAVARRLLTHTLSGEPFRAEVFAFGQSAEDVEGFLEQAAWQANIVVLDNHLDYGHVGYLGTDLLRALLERGYGGLACIRSANSSPYDEALYFQAGAHCCIGKDVHPQAMASTLMAAYLRWEAERLLPETPLTGWRAGEGMTETDASSCSSPTQTALPGTVFYELAIPCDAAHLPLLYSTQPMP